ncbi:TPA: FAD-dependent oxidoreductase [Burkholderia vietnamiensis]|uniref:FAD-dependent oxidoreductase n=1 Tax=Burkholderia vietnamiensis TaxID=60552 RepID=A0AA44XUI9_BURVI|nr:FAD-dependent oxidoreductase [Burkholderia vietnamiensis]KVS11267.1 FAD-dependent oxidoreductase [Burkholderia vietnamiensis]MCA8209833.1 FAD-dependent oxidoreductase [Burkholderia vietnamiensis]PRH38135.1 FAD-dependent oxidoreductase [Burkholderia vietnamiensis]HDR9098975.1 FAD-dependent oxidoreductase [Burkholderia vietnamiensis]HDR9119135.1 FAD-dependent oxidoreductase [Burkholderia vietnamiensis]
MATMSIDYQTLKFDYRPRAARAAQADAAVHPVIVVGAGPVGLAAAIDLAQRGVPVVLLDDDDTLSTGSRAICFAKRTLEIFDRLGCGERFVDKGVSWHVGKVFLQDEQLYAFDLLPEQGHARPAFVNLQQYYVEGYLAERAFELPNLEIRWKHKVTGVAQSAEHAALTVETPEGIETLRAQYVIAADGSRSPLRAAMGLESRGRTFKDRFLIADVKMKAEFPTERWFWFDPPFHRNQSVLLHRQPDNVWRIDFQLGWDADPVAEKQPERVIPRVRALLGPDAEFELEWVSVYTFRCQRMDTFRHGRVLFAGDAAHGVSPFGARGANSGVQDADNLAWKLQLVLDGRAPERLLDTHASEREFAADENIRNSTRSTDFITPKSAVSRVFRDATLTLARDCEFARRLVNSGRLSVPAVLTDSPLNTPDRAGDAFACAMRPGAVAADAPVRAQQASGWLLRHLGDGFAGVLFGLPGDAGALAQALDGLALPVRPVLIVPAGHAQAVPGVDVLEEVDGLAAQRYDAQPGTFYLLRPDQHVCARMRALDRHAIADALARASGAC